MSNGEMTAEDVDIFKLRIVSDVKDVPKETIHLFLSNEEVENSTL